MAESHKSEKLLIVLGFIAVTLIWSSTWLVIKVGEGSVPPIFGVAFRFGYAMIVIAIISYFRKAKLLWDRNSVLLYFILGFFSFSIPYILVYEGEERISSGLTSIIFAVYPLVVAVISHFVLATERLTFLKISGILVGIFGLAVIFWTDLSQGGVATTGSIMVVVSTMFQGASLVCVKKMGKHISPLTLNLGGMLVGNVVLICLAFALEDVSTVHLDVAGALSIVYLGTFGTVVAFVVYYWLLKRVDAVLLSLTTLVTPVLAVVLGVWLLHEAFSRRIYAGGFLVLLGILITNSREVLRSLMKAPHQIEDQLGLPVD
jgi:drug/metabolite transporter (DMT)-like permease